MLSFCEFGLRLARESCCEPVLGIQFAGTDAVAMPYPLHIRHNDGDLLHACSSIPHPMLPGIIATNSVLDSLSRFGPEFSSDESGDGPNLTLLSANITSLRKNWVLTQAIDASYYFLQETTLNTHGQSSMRKSLHCQGYDALFCTPSDFKFSGSQTRISLWNARSGGLAAVGRRPLPMKMIKSTSAAYDASRCMQTWIPTGLGVRGLHVFNAYGHVGAGAKNQHAYALNENLMSSILQEVAVLGDVPALIVGDLQTCPVESATLGHAVQSGQVFDLGALFTDSTWTYQKGNDTKIFELGST